MASWILCLIVALPALTFATLGLGWLLGWEPQERVVTRLTAVCYLAGTVLALVLAVLLLGSPERQVVADLGHWFEVEHHGFVLRLVVDSLSMPLVALSVILVGVIGVFSTRYLHRDPGFLRFFLLLNLFGFGILLLFTAGSFDLMIGGWELVGLTSVMLIAFFQYRNEPVQSALRVFATYRACDVGLLAAVVMMHRYGGSALFSELFHGSWPNAAGVLIGREATVVGLLLLLAAMGKAAQVPFSGWLPRAMEGPTPSSAVFYGALSVHAGAYLLLRAQPILAQSPWVSGLVVAVGLLTALHGTMAGRVAADAKTSLAHASLTQLGLIFMEIGLGWNGLAVFHLCGHAAVRTLEFLRAPSMLHDFHHAHAASGGDLGRTGAHYEQMLPAGARNWLYRMALDRSHLDTLLEKVAVAPLMWVARLLRDLEQGWMQVGLGGSKPRRKGPAERAGLHGSEKRVSEKKKVGNVNA